MNKDTNLNNSFNNHNNWFGLYEKCWELIDNLPKKNMQETNMNNSFQNHIWLDYMKHTCNPIIKMHSSKQEYLGNSFE